MIDTEDISTSVSADGYAVIRNYRLDDEILQVLSSIGTLVTLPGMNVVQYLTPKSEIGGLPNTYSGNFGMNDFPYHADLAHWYRPPRYFILRCLSGTNSVATRLINADEINGVLGLTALKSALVTPRRPHGGYRSLLHLIDVDPSGSQIFRWDSLFLIPATKRSAITSKKVNNYLLSTDPIEVVLENPGDTLIVDNWRMIHGRSPVPDSASKRRIARAYLGELR